jgi:plasmid stabilization system protein ParE
MNYYFLEPAKQELEEVVAYYEQQREGLGEEFALEFKSALQRILNHPLAWTTLSKNIRRCRTNRFPYGIVYNLQGDDIVIVAVMHLHRKPGYWKDRL